MAGFVPGEHFDLVGDRPAFPVAEIAQLPVKLGCGSGCCYAGPPGVRRELNEDLRVRHGPCAGGPDSTEAGFDRCQVAVSEVSDRADATAVEMDSFAPPTVRQSLNGLRGSDGPHRSVSLNGTASVFHVEFASTGAPTVVIPEVVNHRCDPTGASSARIDRTAHTIAPGARWFAMTRT